MVNTELESTTGFLSLAELASLNTDDVATLLSRVAQPGIYIVVGKAVKGAQSEAEGKAPLLRFNYQYEVESAKLVDKKIDPETLVGRVLTESYTLWSNQIQELLGLLKGRYQKIGLPNSGMPLGGVEGMEPGWLDTFVGHRFTLRVRTFISKGETRAAFDWVGPVEEVALDGEEDQTGA